MSLLCGFALAHLASDNVLTWEPAGSTGYSVMPIVSLDRFSVRALISCSTVPQNLTSGRRSERLTPKSLVLEASGSGGWGQSLRRHLAARTLCGPSTKIRRGVSLVDTVTIVRITPALYGLQHGALRNLALGYIAPDRNQQLAGERNDRDPADPPAFIADAGVEPTAQGAPRLMSLP
jgi:hypothetical protein